VSHTTKSQDRLLLVAEVAAKLNVGPDQVIALIRAHKLVAFDISVNGRKPRWRVDPADLDRFLASRRPSAMPARSPRRRANSSTVIQYF